MQTTILFALVLGQTKGDQIAGAAIAQLAWQTRYDASYAKLGYPMGDVPRDRGACTDVVIRALRVIGRDLQQEIHEDARAHPGLYPRIASLDKNIDHRRCPNLRVLFGRFGKSLPLSEPTSTWKPGEIVFWKLPSGLDHVGIVTRTPKGGTNPWVVHNIAGIAHEDALTRWKIVGRYRFP